MFLPQVKNVGNLMSSMKRAGRVFPVLFLSEVLNLCRNFIAQFPTTLKVGECKGEQKFPNPKWPHLTDQSLDKIKRGHFNIFAFGAFFVLGRKASFLTILLIKGLIPMGKAVLRQLPTQDFKPPSELRPSLGSSYGSLESIYAIKIFWVRKFFFTHIFGDP